MLHALANPALPAHGVMAVSPTTSAAPGCTRLGSIPSSISATPCPTQQRRSSAGPPSAQRTSTLPPSHTRTATTGRGPAWRWAPASTGCTASRTATRTTASHPQPSQQSQIHCPTSTPAHSTLLTTALIRRLHAFSITNWKNCCINWAHRPQHRPLLDALPALLRKPPPTVGRVLPYTAPGSRRTPHPKPARGPHPTRRGIP
jgi:hypothetical protein